MSWHGNVVVGVKEFELVPPVAVTAVSSSTAPEVASSVWPAFVVSV